MLCPHQSFLKFPMWSLASLTPSPPPSICPSSVSPLLVFFYHLYDVSRASPTLSNDPRPRTTCLCLVSLASCVSVSHHVGVNHKLWQRLSSKDFPFKNNLDYVGFLHMCKLRVNRSERDNQKKILSYIHPFISQVLK